MLYVVIYLIIYYALYIKVRLPLEKVYECNYNNRLYLKWLKNHLKKAFNHFDIYAGILTVISFYVSFKIKVFLLVLAILLILYDTENIKYTLMVNKDNLRIPKENRIIRLLSLYIMFLIIPFILGLFFKRYRVFYIGVGIVFLVFFLPYFTSISIEIGILSFLLINIITEGASIITFLCLLPKLSPPLN